MPRIASHRVERVGGVDAGDDRLAHAFDDEAERVVLGDRLGRLDHQFLGEEGGGEEEHDEDQREEALDDAGAAGAQGDRGAEPADRQRRRGDQGDREQRPGDAALDLGAEDQADREEPERREEAERGGPGEPAEDDREARDRRREEAVGEAHLDVDGERDAAAVAGQHHRLHHRPGEHELEEALDFGGKPGSSTRRRAPPVWIASSRVGKTMIGAISCGRRKVWRTERMPERPHDPQVGRQRAAHASTGSCSAFSSLSSSRW